MLPFSWAPSHRRGRRLFSWDYHAVTATLGLGFHPFPGEVLVDLIYYPFLKSTVPAVLRSS